MKIYLVVVLLVLANLLAACNTTTAPSSGAPVTTSPGDISRGKTKFSVACSLCHGAEGKGITGLAPALQNSPFVKSQTDDQLIAFIKKGRAKDDPENKSKIAMPPKGDNLTLTEQDLVDIVAYMRTLQK